MIRYECGLGSSRMLPVNPPTDKLETVNVSRVEKRKRERASAKPEGQADQKKTKVEQNGILPPDIMLLIANNFKYKGEVVDFEEAAKFHRDYTRAFWERQIQIEGLDLFKNDPQKTPKENYLYAKAVANFAAKIFLEDSLAVNAGSIFRELKPLESLFPDLYKLFCYVLYQRSLGPLENPFSSDTEQTRQWVYLESLDNVPGAMILQGLLNPVMASFWLATAAKCKSIASYIALHLPNIPLDQRYIMAVSAADRGDYHAFDALWYSEDDEVFTVQEWVSAENRQYPAVLLEKTENAKPEESEPFYDAAFAAYGSLTPLRVLRDMALCKKELGKYEEAESLITQAVGNYRRKEGFGFLLIELARLKIQLKKWAEAESLLERVIALGGFSDKLLILAKVKTKLEKNEEAEVLYDRIILQARHLDAMSSQLQEEPVKHSPTLFADAASIKAKRENYGEADELFQQAFEIFANNPKLWKPKQQAKYRALRAFTKSKLGQTLEAERLYDKAVALYGPKAPVELLVEVAQFKMELSKRHEAYVLLDQAQALYQSKGIEIPEMITTLIDSVKS